MAPLGWRGKLAGGRGRSQIYGHRHRPFGTMAKLGRASENYSYGTTTFWAIVWNGGLCRRPRLGASPKLAEGTIALCLGHKRITGGERWGARLARPSAAQCIPVRCSSASRLFWYLHSTSFCHLCIILQYSLSASTPYGPTTVLSTIRVATQATCLPPTSPIIRR